MFIKKTWKVFFNLLVVISLISGGCNVSFALIQPPGNLHIGTTLSAAAAQLGPGQSIKISTTGLTSSATYSGEAANFTQWGNTGNWDPIRKKGVWVGKRHSTFPYHRLEYDEVTNTWSNSESLHPDLTTGQSGHGYDGTAVDPATGDIYVRRYNDATVYHWIKSTDTWERLPDVPGSVDIAEAVEWWPGRGLVFSDAYGARLYNGSSWSQIVSGASVSNIGYHSFGQVQPNADVYIFGGGNAGPQKIYRLAADDTLTLLGAAPIGLGNSSAGQGILVDDPASSNFIAWDQASGWYSFNPITDTWSSALSVCSGDGSTACDGMPNFSEADSIAIPIQSYGVIMFFGPNSNDVWLYKHTAKPVIPPPDNSDNSLQSFKLTSGVNGETPFTVGLGFKEGDMAGTPTLNLNNYQVEVKRTWPDGSVKHAIVAGTYNSSAGQPYTVKVFNSGEVPTGTDLTEADIVDAAPNASVKIGSYGTVNLSSLLGFPQRVWLSGPEMVEAHYYGLASSDPYIGVKFYVRLYKNGKMFVRAIVENGNLMGGTSSDISYVPTISIGGSTVFNNGGSTITQYAHQRYDVSAWIGMADPGTTIAQDTKYLMASGLVPNYWKTGPSQSTLNSLTQSYLPLQKGDWTTSMGATGYQSQIGLLPIWDALYLNSFGNSTAYKSVITNARTINSYPLTWPDPNTGNPIVISDRPTYTKSGANGGGATGIGAGSLSWDVAHHGSAGYLAYLITGDYYFLETMEYQADLCYLVTAAANGSGTNRLIRPVQTRGVAWATRTYGQLAGIAPTGGLTDDVIDMLNNSASHWVDVINQPGMNNLGYLYSYEIGAYGLGVVSPWQQHFWVQSLGYISDLKYSSDMTDFDFVKQHMYKSIVGILGGNSVDEYCYTEAAHYTIKISATSTSDATSWYDSWGTVFAETTGAVNDSCGTTLSGYVSSDAKTTYWGNLLPAIAYAVDDGAPGAAAAFNRVIGASNWSGIENGGWEDVPVWGIWPRILQ